MLTQQQFDKRWPEIKGGLRNLWRDISDEELDDAKDNIYELSHLIEERFGESKEEIVLKLDRLLESFDNNTDKDIDPDVSSYHRSPI